MGMTEAPLFTEVHPGPEDGVARWIDASDGVRLRIGVWGRGAEKGTVFLFPGRTEYVEKYGLAAHDLFDRGFCTAAIDWRGQGLAERLQDDARIGHVVGFRDYQLDVAAMLQAARTMDLPKPYFMLGHSMGGCIALRAVLEEFPVQAVAFSAPMWGIKIAAALQPVAWSLTRLMPRMGFGEWLAPTTMPEPYVLVHPFEDNMLTTDAEMHAMMKQQVSNHPELCLGGPSYAWLGQAIWECNELALHPSPKLPCIGFLGGNERIVHTGRIHERMERWPGATLHMMDGCEHEVMMESPEVRAGIFDKVADHFAKAA